MVVTERPFFILALKGKVSWPRMYELTIEPNASRFLDLDEILPASGKIKATSIGIKTVLKSIDSYFMICLFFYTRIFSKHFKASN